jgi:cell division protein FtsZ
MHSPLLNNNDIYKSKKLLFNIYYNPNEPMLVEEINAVNNFMEQFEYENIEVIWGLSKDLELKEGEVKVTVLATGFGMNNIPGMEPIIEQENAEKERITLEELKKHEAEEQQLAEMERNFYKDEYKFFIFEGDEINNDELISALDNSPAYKRTVQELDALKNITAPKTPTIADEIPAPTTEEEEATTIETNY